MELQRWVQLPSRYRLLIRWDTLENHTGDFRGSDDFPWALSCATRARAQDLTIPF